LKKTKIFEITNALIDIKGINPLVLDVGDLVSYTDYLILCSGSSDTHVRALVSVVEAIKGLGKMYINSSIDDSWWIIDYVDVVVHVFREDVRLFYDLESLWCDAKPVTLSLPV
jgi:ribosome-associated protein